MVEEGQVKLQLNKLQRKFNLLCSWLQLKFDEDPSFPSSILENGKEEIEVKLEPDSDPIELFPHKPKTGINAVDIEAVFNAKRTEVGFAGITKPCFVSVQRLESEEDGQGGSDPNYCSVDSVSVSGSGEESEDLCSDPLWAPPPPQWLPEPEDTTRDSYAGYSHSNQEPAPMTDQGLKNQLARKIGPRLRVQCTFCMKYFHHRSIFDHIRSKHQAGATEETFAAYGPSRRKSKLKHFCPICNEGYSLFSYWKTHLMRFHPDVYEEKFGSADTRQVRRKKEKRHNPPYSFECPVCHKMYPRRAIYSHVRSVHNDVATTDTYTSIRKSVKQMISKFHPSSIFACPVCHQGFKVPGHFNSHLKKLHADVYHSEKIESEDFLNSCVEKEPPPDTDMVPCSDCGKVVTRRKLLQHMNSMHRNLGLFLCPVCGFTTKKKFLLDSHSKIHSEAREFKCSLCPYAAKQHQGLRMHFHRAHNPSHLATQCSYCGEFLKGKHNLEKHVQAVHENVRPFPCNLCDKAFKTRSHLKYHVRTHANPIGRKRGINKEREPKRRREKSLENVIYEVQGTPADVIK